MTSLAVAAPGSSGTGARGGRVEHRVGGARADDEARARPRRIVVLPRRQHRAGADEGALDLVRDRPDHLERGRRAQRDLEHRQAARDQRARQRHRGRSTVSTTSTGTTGVPASSVVSSELGIGFGLVRVGGSAGR